MFDLVLDGIKAIIVGGAKIFVGAANAVWSVMKFAFKATLWVIDGVFKIAEHLASYVIKTISKLFKPKKVVVVPPKKLPALQKFLEEQEKGGGIAEDPVTMEISNNLEKATNKGQSMIFATGEDADGEIAVSDPQFISAKSYDQKIAEAAQNNQIYIKKIRIAD